MIEVEMFETKRIHKLWPDTEKCDNTAENLCFILILF